MSQFNIYSIQKAPLAAQPLLEGAQQKFGFVPNLLGGFAESPTVLQAYLDIGALFEKNLADPSRATSGTACGQRRKPLHLLRSRPFNACQA